MKQSIVALEVPAREGRVALGVLDQDFPNSSCLTSPTTSGRTIQKGEGEEGHCLDPQIPTVNPDDLKNDRAASWSCFCSLIVCKLELDIVW
jgi:hypothetical protein